MAVWSLRVSSTCGRLRISPSLLFEREPLGRYREIAFGIRLITGFEPLAEVLHALCFDVVPYRPVDEPAPGAGGRNAAEHGHGLVGQNNVDALAHGG